MGLRGAERAEEESIRAFNFREGHGSKNVSLFSKVKARGSVPLSSPHYSLAFCLVRMLLSRGCPSRLVRVFPLTMNKSVTKKLSASAEAASSPRTPAKNSTRKRRIATSMPTTTTTATATPPPPTALPWTRDSLAAAARSLASLDPRLASLIEEHGVPFEKLLPKKAKEEGGNDAPPPPPHHFATLARAVVGQQVSGAAAATIYARVLSACCGGADVLGEAKAKDGSGGREGGRASQRQQLQLLLTPEALLAAPPGLLRAAGLSERKASYLVGLAEKFSEGAGKEAGGGEVGGEAPPPLDLRLDVLAAAGDADAVAAELVSIRGVGLWTAHMHLIFHCGSPDVLPVGDLGIRKGFARLFGGGSGSGGGGGNGAVDDKRKKAKSSSSPANLPSEARMLELAEPFRPHRSLLSYYLWRAAG